MTLQQLAEQYLELYDSRLEEDRQCTGRHQLKALVTEGKEESTANDLVAFHPMKIKVCTCEQCNYVKNMRKNRKDKARIKRWLNKKRRKGNEGQIFVYYWG